MVFIIHIILNITRMIYNMYIFFQIGDTTLETTKKAKELDSEAQTLFGRAKTVSTQNTANELNLEKAESQAAQANTSATQATKV